MDRQVHADCNGQDRNPQNPHSNGQEYPDEHQVPGQVAKHNAFHHHLHQYGLRRWQFLRAIAPCGIQQVHNAADNDRRENNPDDFTNLLFFRRSAYQKARL